MSERSFRAEITELKPGESKEYTANIPSMFSASGKKEMFYVDVFRSSSRDNYPYKLQWLKDGKPKRPELKKDIEKQARERFKNMAFLTSGFGNNEHSANTTGIKDIDTLVLVVKELRTVGIFIRW